LGIVAMESCRHLLFFFVVLVVVLVVARRGWEVLD